MEIEAGSVCRVCHGEEEPERPLFHPCNCSGSIKYIHQDCLVEWFKVSKKEHCELCGQKITFNRVYAPETPAVLGFSDIVSAVIPSVTDHMLRYCDGFIKLLMWLVILPIVTSFILYSAVYYSMFDSLLDWRRLYSIMNAADDNVISWKYPFGFWCCGVLEVLFICIYSIVLTYCGLYIFELIKRIKASQERLWVTNDILNAMRRMPREGRRDGRRVDNELHRDGLEEPVQAVPAPGGDPVEVGNDDDVEAAAPAPFEVEVEVDPVVEDVVDDDVEAAAPAPFEVEVDPVVENVVDNEVDEAAAPAPLEVEVDPVVENVVNDEVEAAAPAPLEVEVDPLVENEVDDEVEAAAPAPFEVEVDPVVEDVVDDDVEAAAPAPFEVEVDPVVDSEVNEAPAPFEVEVDPVVEDVVDNEVEAAAPAPLEVEVAVEVDPVVENEVDDEVEDNNLGAAVGDDLPRPGGADAGEINFDDLLGNDAENVIEIPVELNVSLKEAFVRFATTVVVIIVVTMMFYLLPCAVGGLILRKLEMSAKIYLFTEEVILSQFSGVIEANSFAPFASALGLPLTSMDMVYDTNGGFSPVLFPFMAHYTLKNHSGGALPSSPLDEISFKIMHTLFAWSLGVDVGILLMLLFVVSYLFLTIDFKYMVVLARAAVRSTKSFMVSLGKNFVMGLKVSLFVFIGSILSSLITGVIVDVITLKTLNVTLADRVVEFQEIPMLSAFIHVVIGHLVWSHVSLLLLLIRTHVRAHLLVGGVLPTAEASHAQYLFYDVHLEPGQHDHAAAHQGDIVINDLFRNINRSLENICNLSTNMFLKQILLHFCFTVPVLLFGLLIPVKYGHILSLLGIGGTPLKLDLKEASVDVQIPVELFVLHVVVPFLIEKSKYQSVFRYLVKNYMSIGSYLLCWEYCYTDNSLVPEMAPVVEEVVLGEGEGVMAEEAVLGESVVPPARSFSHRIYKSCENVGLFIRTFTSGWSSFVKSVVFIGFGLCLHTLLTSWVIYVPLTVGRVLLQHSDLMSYLNDLHCYAMGVLICFGVSKLCTLILKDVAMHAELVQYLQLAYQWSKKIFVACALGSIWAVVLPIFIGMTLESVVIVPLRVSWIETAKFPLLQSWAIGIVLLTLWTRIVLSGIFEEDDIGAVANANDNNNAGNQRIATWRHRFLRVMADGITHINGTMIFKDIILPLFVFYADILLTSYFASRTVGFLIFNSSYQLRTVLVRYSFPGLVSMRLLHRVWSSMATIVTKVHAEARDKKYLVGVQLQNSSS